jgi:hypothetical protein
VLLREVIGVIEVFRQGGVIAFVDEEEQRASSGGMYRGLSR